MDVDKVLEITPDISFYNNTIKYYVNRNDYGVSGILKLGKLWEPFMIDIFKTYIKENTYALDIGANIGAHTVVISKLFPNNKIIAFEPVKWEFNILEMNLKLNNIINCQTYNVGLGSKSHHMYTSDNVMRIEKSSNFGAFTLKERKESDLCEIVDIVTLDSYKLNNISFMKIDVETHEIEVLKGALETIKLCKPTMIIEIDPRFADKFFEFFDDNLSNIGYKYKLVSKHHDYLFTIDQ